MFQGKNPYSHKHYENQKEKIAKVLLEKLKNKKCLPRRKDEVTMVLCSGKNQLV
jgi:hypothetical protein